MGAQGEVSVDDVKREWRVIQAILVAPVMVFFMLAPLMKPGCAEGQERSQAQPVSHDHDHHECVEVERPKKVRLRYRNIVLVIPEDGCEQERDCECGVCPPY